MRQLAELSQSTVVALKAALADAVHGFGKTFVATFVVTFMAIAIGATQSAGLTFGDEARLSQPAPTY